jgi:ATP-dependent exoDNAse (exonuclease V) beta subunit
MRRILYVVATRAREELHFFARPAYTEQKDGSLEIAKAAGTLLATAWPAIQNEVQERFGDWLAAHSASQSEPDTIATLAAGAEGNLAVMPAPPKPAILRRLPADYKPPCDNSSPEITDPHAVDAAGPQTPTAGATHGGSVAQLYSRHEGGLLSRAVGDAVHMLLEQLARLRAAMEWDAARSALQTMQPRVAAEVRALGLSPRQAQETAAQAMGLALDASADAAGAWILSPHPQAASEIGWNGVIGGTLRSVRVDRVFQAGLTPCTVGDGCWWIVDYKTAHLENLTADAALPTLRPLFATQLEAYAEVLRKLHSDGRPIRVALYYPRLRALDWWEPEI